MKTAVDTSVLLAVLKGEPGARAWMDLLVQARRAGKLVICEVVYAEFSAALGERSEVDEILDRLAVQLEPTTVAAAFEAGRTFRRYRERGGPRERLIPDFLIGAHASAQADRLAAIDRGFLRRYFDTLKLVQPAAIEG